jgi:hypothetical protein
VISSTFSGNQVANNINFLGGVANFSASSDKKPNLLQQCRAR